MDESYFLTDHSQGPHNNYGAILVSKLCLIKICNSINFYSLVLLNFVIFILQILIDLDLWYFILGDCKVS